jgi:NAD(P)-dependent dehydrogenase (short-subunit alcohol dehydrogenase family)
MGINKWIMEHGKSLKGKKIAVTGSTGGLGTELCAYLAAMGASLVLLDRNEERSLLHKQKLEAQYGIDVCCVRLDLAEFSMADEVVQRLLELQIDVFFHNAGAYSIPRHICDTGYDNVYQINFVTPYYMIQKLLPMLEARGGRVVVVGSIAHNYSKIDPSDVDFHTRGAASRVYGNAKRYLMYSIYDCMKAYPGVSFSVVHPGITFTNITAHYPKPVFLLIKHPMKVIFMKPKKAALSLLAGMFESCGECEWIGPRLFDVWGYPRKKRLRTASLQEQTEIARISQEISSSLYKT